VSRFHFDRIVGAALREAGVRTRVSACLRCRTTSSFRSDVRPIRLAAVEGRAAPERRLEPPSRLRERLGAVGPAFVDVVRCARDRGTWDTAFVDATCDPPESFTYGGMAAHVLTWSAHRRHLVLAALDRHAIAVADADPLAWERAHPN
jgi:AraC family transcriptional regulator